MAEIVYGFASSHGPTMNTPPEKWEELGTKDPLDPRFDFKNLNPKKGIELELNIDKYRARYDAIHRGIASLSQSLREVAPDVIIVFSNTHGSVPTDQMQATFAVHLNDKPPLGDGRPVKRSPEQEAAALEEPKYPTDGDLARFLMNELIEEQFDVAATFMSVPGNLDSVYHLLYERFDTDATIPFVGVHLSRYLPNQCTPRRAYEFGQAIRRVVERWPSDKRVAVMASGGLSHQVIDEDLDRMVIGALEEGDKEVMYSLDRVRLNRGPGTPEILNWLTCAGVMEPRTMTLVEYAPCYRTAAGTGHGMTFGYWK